ncbi:MAG: phosphate/phosphite/phosphonate ABC transporter substrate-binding protein [Desulfatirhabdiaceae bacterium]|nr:phosphate/phosphite/phosphonate ABC transporter substrate-binding protein [Desulfatirhabdiaceae bacterium]
MLFLIVLCIGCPACTGDEPAQKIDLSKREAVEVKDVDDAITYAYLPQYSHSVSFLRHNLLVEYLKKETGYNIRQIFPDTFDEHMSLVGQGKVDISFSNPYAYVKTAHRYGEKAFAQVIENSGHKNFRGQIICRADNPSIRTLEDCKGKRLIAVDLTSAGGYLYPMGQFYDHGIRQQDFAEVHFSPGPGGKQEKVILAVYAGQYDIGLIREGSLNVVADKIDIRQIRVIAYSKFYPGWVYSARKNLNPEVLHKIQTALFKLSVENPEHLPILENANFTRIVPSNDAEFDSVRELMSVVGIDLDK